MGTFVDLKNKRFANLVVIECVGRDKHGNALWNCRCDCGNEKVIRRGVLLSGKAKSCGCMHREASIKAHTIHGKYKSKIYSTWHGMKDRCCNENTKYYKFYGGRGITVCDEWKDNFQAFYDYVSQLSHYGEEGYTLDRINNEGNYEPGNVRWATKKEQASNRRRRQNVKDTYFEVKEKLGL